jgi:hypothetical protein
VPILAYLLYARPVEPQKARNTVHYATIDEAVFSPCHAVPSRASLVATQLYDKHIPVAANQHSTVQNAVFSACPALTSHKSG